MNPSVFHIIQYIINNFLFIDHDLYSSSDLTKELMSVGFGSDEINQAYQFMSYFVPGKEDSVKLTDDYFSSFFMAEPFQSVLHRINETLILFRELNLVTNQKIEQIFQKIEINYQRLEEPEFLFGILMDIFGELEILTNPETYLVLFPLAFPYRKVL